MNTGEQFDPIMTPTSDIVTLQMMILLICGQSTFAHTLASARLPDAP